MYQRRKQQYVFASFVSVVVILVALFYLVFYRPVRSEYSSLQASILELRAGIVQRRGELERLENAEHRLENAGEARSVFLSSNLVSRGVGYAALLPDLVAMARRAGIQRSGAAQFLTSDEPMYGVYPVQILEPVRGTYSSVRRYIEELETSERFFLLDSISMSRAEEGGGGQLDAQLTMSTFFADSGWEADPHDPDVQDEDDE